MITLGQPLRQTQSQRLALSRDLLRGIGLMALSGSEIAEALREAAAEIPGLRLRGAPPPVAPQEDIAAEGPSLAEHVLAQLPRLVPAPADRPLALTLIEALDARGFVTQPLATIARAQGLAEADLARVLAQLQRIEPRGLFTRDLGECLALQLDRVDPTMARLLAALPALTEGGPAALARAAGLSDTQVAQGLAALRDLDPRPAAGFSTGTHAPPRIADLRLSPGTAGWQVALETHLSLSLPPEAPRSAQSRARPLITALERRNAALLALGQVLVREQAGFLSEGPGALRPLTRRAVAAELGLHESTISRLVAANAALTPRGVLALGSFFARAPH
ncbi:MAG: hypothetical protein IE922_11435 [Sphingomonadales bacterium]|nr:hypothetical protein [Sphingomonadales bacterium]